MFLEDVTAEQAKLGIALDNITKEHYDFFSKKCAPFNEHPEYKIDLMACKNPDAQLAGYLKFVSGLHGQKDYVMTAIKTEQGFRGKNLSDVLMEILFQFAELNNTSFSSTVQQRKPLTAFILHGKYGFGPVQNRPRDVVEILGRYDESKLLIAFRDPTKRTEFERSNLCTESQQYLIVKPQQPLMKDTVTLLTPYILSDPEKCSERRGQIQKRFSISFEYNE